MDERKKAFLLLTLVSAMMLFASHAHASTVSTATISGAGAPTNADTLQGPAQKAAMHQIRAAVRGLEQAALQADFASNAEELALLQSAHDRLQAAARSLCCAKRARSLRLAADIDHVIARASAHFGPLVSPDGDFIGPPAPSQNQLAQLATEGRELVRNVPTAHGFVDTDALELTAPTPDGAKRPAGEDQFEMAGTNPLLWPPSGQEAPSQLHFQF